MSARRRHLSAGLGVLALAGATLAVVAGPAAADGPTTFTNSTSISVPSGSSSDQSGPASPYPSPITVSGLSGAVSKVTVTLANLSHSTAGDIDALLVAPDGSSLVIMSDPGDPQWTFASNATLTFDDSASGPLPSSGAIATGTYQPTDNDPGGAPDSFPSPAPAPSTNTTLAGAFTGVAPNGDWKLFVVDDATGDTGTIAGGWSLTLTTSATAAPTTTTVSSAPNPATTGDPVTLGADVVSSGSPVTAGSVSFSDNGSSLGAAVPLDGSGHAELVTSTLTEGSHLITATYSGTTDFLTSNGSTTQVVDNPTVVHSGRRFCNEGGISVPDQGQSTPYASRVTTSGVLGRSHRRQGAADQGQPHRRRSTSTSSWSRPTVTTCC